MTSSDRPSPIDYDSDSIIQPIYTLLAALATEIQLVMDRQGEVTTHVTALLNAAHTGKVPDTDVLTDTHRALQGQDRLEQHLADLHRLCEGVAADLKARSQTGAPPLDGKNWSTLPLLEEIRYRLDAAISGKPLSDEAGDPTASSSPSGDVELF